MKHLVISDNGYAHEVHNEWELKSYLETLEELDWEFTIFEFDEERGWVEAEFGCPEEHLVQTVYGSYVEHCGAFSNDPRGCDEHRWEL